MIGIISDNDNNTDNDNDINYDICFVCKDHLTKSPSIQCDEETGCGAQMDCSCMGISRNLYVQINNKQWFCCLTETCHREAIFLCFESNENDTVSARMNDSTCVFSNCECVNLQQ